MAKANETQENEPRKKPNRVLPIILGTILVIGIVFGIKEYIYYGKHVDTDDAQVDGNISPVVARVGGYVDSIYFEENTHVNKDQILVKIDDRDFKTALNQAKADVAASEAAVKNLDAQIELQQPLIQQQAAEVDATEATLKFAQQERARYDELMKSGSGTIQRAQQTDAALHSQTAQLAQGKAGLIAAGKKIEVLSTQRAQAVAQLARARDLQEAMEIQSRYAQRQMKNYAEQAQDLGRLMTDAAQKMQPPRG